MLHINKLLYFASVGEKVTIKAEDFAEIWEKVRKNSRKRRFKYDKIENNYIIWRVK